MFSPRTILARGVTLGLLAAMLALGAFLVYVTWYAKSDRIFPGVRIGPVEAGGMARREVARLLLAAGGLPRSDLSGPPVERPAVQLRLDDQVWLLERSQVGPAPDVSGALHQAAVIGREGTILHKGRTFLAGLIHGHYIPVPAQIREEQIREQLGAIARAVDRPARDATYDFATDTLTPDQDGLQLDIEASHAAVTQAILVDNSVVQLVARPVAARVRAADLAGAKRYQIARFTTPILAADPGRVHNIGMAVRKISGVMLKPGEIFSFNDLVGPRDAANGWAQAKEIYRGEFVMGYGGGICQVSSTLYNSVLLGGLEVKERYHHDRPLEYVRPGRDATVAWKALDFRFRNSLNTPVLVGARVLPGRPAQIEVTLHAPRPPEGPAISLEETDLRYFPPELVEVLDPSLPAGERVVVDEGLGGLEIKVYRVYSQNGQERRELVSHDHYQPKAGRVRVGVGNAPGSQRLLQPGMQ